MFTADQIERLRIYVTKDGDIVELNASNLPVRVVGHLEELDYRYLIQAVIVQFNALALVRKSLETTLEVLERANIDALSAGLQSTIGTVDLAQKLALYGPLALFEGSRKDGK